ncbi:MAG: glycerophosphodiester phosphodiesterase [Acidobacteria bacterium]|nr:glycerophosphodiester phosphodiesterase [Acidobacteriota bacterium]
MNRSFLAIAHRGARAFAPENTLPAIRAAERLGANVVELDVQMSRDGELVVFHDDTILRCSDGLYKFPAHTDYSVGAFTWEELSLLDVGAWYVHELARPASRRQPYLRDLGPEELGEWVTPADADEYESGSVRIPRLRDALSVARECPLAVVLDLKAIPRRYSGIAGRTVELVRDLGMVDETLISSFDHTLLAEVRRLDQTLATGVLTSHRLYRPREYLQALDADALHPACPKTLHDADRAMIEELTSAGFQVNVWTENTTSRMRALIDAGVTGIFTDYPNRLGQVLRDVGRCVSLRPRLRRPSASRR